MEQNQEMEQMVDLVEVPEDKTMVQELLTKVDQETYQAQLPLKGLTVVMVQTEILLQPVVEEEQDKLVLQLLTTILVELEETELHLQ